jgi:chemotaxis protein histidine kinase CheA
MNAEARRRFEERIALLKQGFLDHLGVYVAELEQLVRDMSARPDELTLKRVYRAVHSLAGTALTFGIDPLGDEARALARYIATLDDAARTSADTRREVAARLRDVTFLARAAADDPGRASSPVKDAPDAGGDG